MTNNIDNRLKQLGIEIPKSAPPVANYLPYKKVGHLLYVSGQLAQYDGALKFTGKVYSLEEATKAARLCCLNVIAQVKAALNGHLDKVVNCIRLTVYINSTDGFTDHAKVANGASNLILDVFEEKGKHTRAAIGTASLPYDSLVEIDAIFEVEDA